MIIIYCNVVHDRGCFAFWPPSTTFPEDNSHLGWIHAHILNSSTSRPAPTLGGEHSATTQTFNKGMEFWATASQRDADTGATSSLETGHTSLDT